MDKRITALHDVHPQTKKLTTKVQVLEKSFPRSSQNTSSFQKLIIGDSQGTLVHATIFGSDIQLLEHTLKTFKKYYVSNALVRNIQLCYRKGIENKYQWTINGATLNEEVKDTDDEPNTEIKFTPFTELRADTDSIADIIGVVTQIFMPRQVIIDKAEVPLQELVVVMEELKPTLITMWDQYLNNECIAISNIIDSRPIIVGMRLKIRSYNGVSLSTKSSSCILINPEIPQAKTLRSWCDKHKDQIDKLTLVAKDVSQTNKKGPTPSSIVTAKEANSMETTDNFWVNVTTSITNFEQSFWYTRCSGCHKAIHTDCGTTYECVYCKMSRVAEPRCRFDVQLSDASGHVIAKCFGQHAEKLFKFTATDLKENSDENRVAAQDFLESRTSTATHLILLKPYIFTQTNERKLTIVSIKDETVGNPTSTIT